jgi:excinuclease UvrABC nuclease subunit
MRERIGKQKVNLHNGLYVYVNSNKEVIYIGKGKPIKNRILSHYDECFKSVRGDTSNQRWHRFFCSNQGELTVCWIKLEDEDNRKIIEQNLTFVLKPKFLEFK